MTRVVEDEQFIPVAVIAKPAVLKVPCRTAIPAFEVSASPSVTVMPAVLRSTLENVLPAVVSVPVLLNTT